MNFFITYDADWEAKIDQVLYTLQETGYDTFFESCDYGKSLVGINIVLMCRNPLLNFRQRIRYSKKEKELYIDIMLDFKIFTNIDLKEKTSIVQEKLIQDIPSIITGYKFIDFNVSKFEIDLKAVFRW